MDFSTLLPQIGDLIFTLVSFIVALSIIVGVHEYGHYIVGRWSGIKADAFSIGFGPVLWSRFDKHGTKWQIAAIPFGGYVKFAGDANAASGVDTEVMEATPEAELRHTMHGAPIWARAATVLAGPAFNFIFSIAVFTLLLLVIGVRATPPQVSALYDLPPARYTIAEGDVILGIEGKPFPQEETREYFAALPAKQMLSYRVQRGADELDVMGPQYAPARIGMVQPRSAGEAAGLLEGDVILTANGQKVERFQELIGIVGAADGAPVKLTVWRKGAGEDLEFAIVPRLSDLPTEDNGFEKRWLIGISSSTFFEPTLETPSVKDALGAGVDKTFGVVTGSISALYHLATGQIGRCNLSGAIGIARASGHQAERGLADFIAFLALLSTAVGFINLLPVPMLDGGHLMFHAFEAVTRRKPSDKAMNVMMIMGLTVVLSFMLFGLSNDIFC
ncbi:RIP metalloprotease RseP [Lentibacter algarum]|uniref:RIP metalloprotease RseP n=1 Tax=Lentibacter algarum TaxID=576131 RepID=UPI001C0A44A6|nr:RIP metalloprotease RseP [Lentibacter algarum]MBU2982482.1 RIP metalloprotease RseP [Lentibacter algarum]